jgi:hypothetical protein
MTLLALGDFTRAQQWLSYATVLERNRPGILDRDEKRLLQLAWHQLDDSLRNLAIAAKARETEAASSEQASLPESDPTLAAPVSPVAP